MSETPKTFRKRSAIGVVFVARNTMFTSTRYMNTFALARMARSSVVFFARLDNKKRGGNMPSDNSNQPKLYHFLLHKMSNRSHTTSAHERSNRRRVRLGCNFRTLIGDDAEIRSRPRVPFVAFWFLHGSALCILFDPNVSFNVCGG
jgi:hypothetical protein